MTFTQRPNTGGKPSAALAALGRIRNLREDIIPTHVGLSRVTFRRFTISIEPNACFADAQLIG